MYLKRGQRIDANGYQNPYFKRKHIRIVFDWNYFRALGRDTLSPQAQLKLEWIIFYHTVGKGNAKDTANHFGITRKTFHKWLARFDEKNLATLEEQARIPVNKRNWKVTGEEEENVIHLRKKNMEYGKKKLKVLYKREYGKVISTWKIERVIRKYKLFPDLKKHDIQVEKRQKSKPKVRISDVKDIISETKRFGFLWHIDAIIIWWYGTRRIIFTAMEEYSKIAFARVYSTNKSSYAEDFLKRLMYLVNGKVEIMHSDNGSEFEGEFQLACRKLNVARIYSRVRTPTDNPALEHFNGTVQEEWLKFSEVGLDDIQEANNDLTTWLVKYNDYRPHEALDYLTPLAYAQETFFKVSPMWSASTNY
ncbi:MAG TPA: integrase core domain-containing protein [Paenisporosarcina sp.]|nr:integrase core domain-containing protein [Paenisporosarcina sp.]